MKFCMCKARCFHTFRNLSKTVCEATGKWCRFTGIIFSGVVHMALRFVQILKSNRDAVLYYSILGLILAVLGSATYEHKSELRNAVPGSSAAMELPLQEIADKNATENRREDMPKYILPTSGEVIGEYSDADMYWNDGLQMWQTHPATDFAAAEGEAVYAIGEGTIIDAYYDELYGYTVVLDLGDEKMACYRSLNEVCKAKVGQTVQIGDEIGAAGKCAAEEEMGSHLHIEYYEKGIAVNLLLKMQTNRDD